MAGPSGRSIGRCASQWWHIEVLDLLKADVRAMVCGCCNRAFPATTGPKGGAAVVCQNSLRWHGRERVLPAMSSQSPTRSFSHLDDCCTSEPAGRPIHTTRPKRLLKTWSAKSGNVVPTLLGDERVADLKIGEHELEYHAPHQLCSNKHHNSQENQA